MASVTETLWVDEQINSTDLTIVGGEEIDILLSDELSNDSGTIYNSVRVVLNYEGLQPNFGNFFIGCLVEAKDDSGKWTPIGYQFTPLRSTQQAPQRIIIIQPNLDTFNSGIDDIVFPVDREVARISRIQGALPESKYRVRVILKDNDPSAASAFQNVTVSGSVEKYNA